MDLPPEFAEILDAAERLSRADQEKLVAILRRRHLEVDRQSLEAQVAQVRHEFESGQYRMVPIPQLVVERCNQIIDPAKYLAATQYSHPQRLMIRTQAFADNLVQFWDSAHPGVTIGELPELLEQLAADAVNPSLPTRRLQGKWNGCRVWSPEPDLDILFDLVPHDRHDAILLLAICQPRWGLY